MILSSAPTKQHWHSSGNRGSEGTRGYFAKPSGLASNGGAVMGDDMPYDLKESFLWGTEDMQATPDRPSSARCKYLARRRG